MLSQASRAQTYAGEDDHGFAASGIGHSYEYEESHFDGVKRDACAHRLQELLAYNVASQQFNHVVSVNFRVAVGH
jgi:hypothetical protein